MKMAVRFKNDGAGEFALLPSISMFRLGATEVSNFAQTPLGLCAHTTFFP
jgi:hypothetical protein